MGGTGADPLARDLSYLTPRERKVYEAACRMHRAGIYPSLERISAELGYQGLGIPSRVRVNVTRKVGWPCPVQRVRGGVHGLTPFERTVLTTAIALWEDLKEYPSKDRVAAVMGVRSEFNVFEAIQRLESLGLFPCPRKPHRLMNQEETKFLVDRLRAGLIHGRILEEFRQRFGRVLHQRQLHRVVVRHGLRRLKPHPPRSRDLESRKAAVIAERAEGFVLHQREEPAAYRRAVRQTRSRKPGSSGRRVSSSP